MPHSPRRFSPPSAEQIQRLNDIGWLESGEVILSEMALLPEGAASTPVARQLLLIHVLNYQGEYDTAVRVALRAIRGAPRSHEVGAALRHLDGEHHVGRTGGADDGRRPAVDHRVPEGASGVVARLAGQAQRAAQSSA